MSTSFTACYENKESAKSAIYKTVIIYCMHICVVCDFTCKNIKRHISLSFFNCKIYTQYKRNLFKFFAY